MTQVPAIRPHAKGVRYTFIDALRGVAALWVACFHFYGGVSAGGVFHVFLQPFHYLFTHGNAGVEIFFVISGFVIAYSIRDKKITPGYFGRFLLRRSIRLEPPYWVTIALAIFVLWISNHIRTDRVASLPHWPQILAHVFYLQGILHMGQIVDVFWTLCIEIQFYISLLLLIALSQKLGDTRASRLAVLAPFTVISLAIHVHLIPDPGPWLFKFWYLFQLGVLSYWAVADRVRQRDYFVYIALLGVGLVWNPSFTGAVGCLTGVAIYLAGRAGKLRTLNNPPLQYLGSRSYSLYLIHPVLGVPFTYYVAQRYFARPLTPGPAILCMSAAVAVSLLGAEILYRLVERPSTELGRRLGKRTESDPVALVAVA